MNRTRLFHPRIFAGIAFAACAFMGSEGIAQAASLQQVNGWASGVPSYISMYEYVPNTLAASPPVLVAAHYCGGSASAMFGFTGMQAIEAAADQYGFIMIFPQTTNPASSKDCWDVGSTASLTHNGGGDTQAIAEMVQYEVSHRNANANRVYAMGASSGAMLTEALLAVYPDVFKAGAEFSGVPAGCWSDGWSAASNWGGTCANGQDIQTAQAWGNMVRGMYSSYPANGYRPRIQLWHGTGDTTINFQNETEAIKEWTNVLGLNTTPNTNQTGQTLSSDTGHSYTIEKWQNSCGYTVLEAYEAQGGGHTTPIDSASVISFFGLDKTTAVDPEVAQCGGDAGADTGAPDTAVADTAKDTSADMGADTAKDAATDTGVVTTADLGVDSAKDTTTDTGVVTTADLGVDSHSPDVAIDTGSADSGAIDSTSTSTSIDSSVAQDSGSPPQTDASVKDTTVVADTSNGNADAGNPTAPASNGCSCHVSTQSSPHAYLAVLLLAFVSLRRTRRVKSVS